MSQKNKSNTIELIEIFEQKQQTKWYRENVCVVITNCESVWRFEKELFAYNVQLSIEDIRYKLKDEHKAHNKILYHLEESSRAPPLF